MIVRPITRLFFSPHETADIADRGAREALRNLLLAALLATASFGAYAQSCTVTLSVGQNLPSAVKSAANDSTICLNSGNWGKVNLFDIRRTGYVTVRSVTAQGAQIAPQVGNSSYIKLDSLRINGFVLQNSCSSNIQWLNNNFDGQYFLLTNSGCGNIATLIEGNTFRNTNNPGGGYDGRLSLIYGSGITVSKNYFGDAGMSDGIFMGGGVSNVTISNNTFSGILESLCSGYHCDNIQLYGAGTGIVIEKNWFKNGDTFIMAPDGSSGVVVRNNVFDGSGVPYEYKVQFGAAANLQYYHNTNYNASVAIDSKGTPASTNAVARNNILTGFSKWKTTGGAGCSNCSFSYNLYDDSGTAVGSNNVIGTPDYVGGGTDPNTWAGWQLSAGSLGKNAGSDNQDVGTNYYGSSTSSQLPAPTNLRLAN